MNLPSSDMDDTDQADLQAKRFTYPSGSRPLDGFTIKRGVGHGGFGEVYYATSDAGKEVALKLIRRSLDIELRGIKQCLNLKHPNLLGVFDIREDARGDHWVVMEYVAGDCLDERLAQHPDGLSKQEALAWFAGIAAGIGYLHDHGIVHRDLKPGNIFSEQGNVSIGDYGLSKYISCSRRSGHTESVGTVHYMAPEVANGRYGKEIDIYALGIILYEMLTGRLPFEGESVGEVLMKHLTAKPDVSMLEEPYRSVVAKALEKDPDQRFPSVEEMVAQLPIDRSVFMFSHASVGQSPIGQNGNGSAERPTRTTPATPSPSTPTATKQVDEEPILREFHLFWANFREWWRGLNPGLQVAVVAFGVLGLAATAELWIPLTVAVLFIYAIYRVIRAIVLSGSSTNTTFPSPTKPQKVTPPEAASPNASMPAKPLPRTRRQYPRLRPHEKPVRALVVKPLRERIADLLGSMLLSAIVAMVLTAVVATIADSVPWDINLEVYAYILLVSIAGTWAVLIPAKFWEGTLGDTMVRRFIMMSIGLLLGLFAWGTLELLATNITTIGDFPHWSDAMPHSKGHDAAPALVCLAAFGSLMLLVRWWRQADPLRSVRLSLWPIFVSVTAAILVALVFQVFGFALAVIAGIMSIAIQITSPWASPRLPTPDPEA